MSDHSINHWCDPSMRIITIIAPALHSTGKQLHRSNYKVKKQMASY